MRTRDEDKQERIKEAVMKLILEYGFERTSVAKIAKEAGVSPATIYVYYQDKEDMFRAIYRECSEDMYASLADAIDDDMSAEDMIGSLMRGYYAYIRRKAEAFSFIEQFSGCPYLACQCSERSGICRIYQAIERRRSEGELADFSERSIFAVLFYPVKALATDRALPDAERDGILEEEIRIIERALLRRSGRLKIFLEEN